MKEQDLFTAIRDYGKTAVPMHMPGHKRNTALLGDGLPYAADITEITGFDDLHDPEDGGIFDRLAARAAELYHARRAFPLVNGSTGGLLAAIRAVTEAGDTVLVARNCHKSVYHALELCALRHISLLPPTDPATGIYGSIRKEDVERALEASDHIRAVILTSPTYEGVISDTAAIADTVHRHGAVLIVDAAHGAHLPFMEETAAFFPYTADIVVTSLHKTLPSLTQTALALVYGEDTPPVQKRASALAREIAVFESSSPSYVLLSSIDRCISFLSSNADARFRQYTARLDAFYRAASEWKHLRLLTGDREVHPDFFAYDKGKLALFSRCAAINGTALAETLRREYAIEAEMAYTDYVLCMTSVCDTDASFNALRVALDRIDRECTEAVTDAPYAAVIEALPPRACTIAEARRLPDLPLTVGEIARAYAWVYPPGVPLVVPGEVYTEETDALLRRLEKDGLRVRTVR